MSKIILLLSLLTCSYCIENPDDSRGSFLSKDKNNIPNHFRGERPADKLRALDHSAYHKTKVSEDSIEDTTDDELMPSSSRTSDVKSGQDYSKGNFHSSGRVKYGQFKNPATSRSELAYCSCCGRYFRDDDKVVSEANIVREPILPESVTREGCRRLSLKQEGGFEKFPELRPDKCRFKTQKVKYSEENYAVNLRNQKKEFKPHRRTNGQREDDSQEPADEPESSSVEQPTSSEDVDIDNKKVNESGLKRKLDRDNDDETYQDVKTVPLRRLKENLKSFELNEPVKRTHERIYISTTPELERFDSFKESADSNIQERNEDSRHPSFRSILQDDYSTTERSALHSRIDSTAVLKVDSPIVGKTSMQKQKFNVTSQNKFADDSLWNGSPADSKGQGSLILHNIEDQKDLHKLKEVINLKYGNARQGNKLAVCKEKEHVKSREKVDKANEASNLKHKSKKVVESNVKADKGIANNVDKLHEDNTKTKKQGRGVKDFKLTHLKKEADVFLGHDTSRINKRNVQETEFYGSSLFDTQPTYTYQESKHLTVPKRETGSLKLNVIGSGKRKTRLQKDVASSVMIEDSKLQDFSNYSRGLSSDGAIKGHYYK